MRVVQASTSASVTRGRMKPRGAIAFFSSAECVVRYVLVFFVSFVLIQPRYIESKSL
jgi:hypothetical protein